MRHSCPNHFAGLEVDYVSDVTYPADLTTLQGLAAIYRADIIDKPLVLPNVMSSLHLFIA